MFLQAMLHNFTKVSEQRVASILRQYLLKLKPEDYPQTLENETAYRFEMVVFCQTNRRHTTR
jgi:hypothetical protein